MKMKPAIFFIALCCLNSAAFGDEEASNVPHIKASAYGRCYAKSIPDEPYGMKGVTKVYRVGKERDSLTHTFHWFSQRLYIACNVSDSKTSTGISLVRLGPWPRGHEATSRQLAIAFHFKGRPIKEYSTLAIAGRPDNVSRSVSHYQVIKKVAGFRWIRGNEYVFEIITTDERRLSFDPTTGEMMN